MSDLSIPTEVQAYASQQLTTIAYANSLVVTNDDEAEAANAFRKQCMEAESRLTEERLAQTRPLDESKSRIMDFFRGPINALTEAKRISKAKIDHFQQEKVRKAKELENRLRAEAEALQRQIEEEARKARDRAQAERLKAEESARKREQEAQEASRKREEALKAGDAEAATKAAVAQRKKEEAAEAARKEGEIKAAVFVREAQDKAEIAARVDTRPTVEAPTKPKGFSTRAVYGIEVVSLPQLIQAIVDGEAEIEFVLANESALRQYAVLKKEAFDVPGVKLTVRQA